MGERCGQKGRERWSAATDLPPLQAPWRCSAGREPLSPVPDNLEHLQVRCGGRAGKEKEEEKNTKGAAKVSSISTYSYEDGPHPDQPDPLVTLFLTIDEADELKKEYVDVTFGSSSVSVTIDLPGNRVYTFRRTSLYESIDPNESTWYLSKSKHRIVLKLAKIDAKKKWPGLTKVRRSF